MLFSETYLVHPTSQPTSNYILMYPVPVKQSILEAIEHLLARYLEMRPLFLAPALPINVEWNIRPYLGVFPFVFNALKI